MNKRPSSKKGMLPMKKDSIQETTVKKRHMAYRRKAALDVRDTIRGHGYLIAIFPINEDGSLTPDMGYHKLDCEHAHLPEILAMFKEKVQADVASRRDPADDGKGPLELIDEAIAENTLPEEADNEQPVDPGE